MPLILAAKCNCGFMRRRRFHMPFDAGSEHRQNSSGTPHAVNARGQKHRIITPERVRHPAPPFGSLDVR